MDIWRIHLVLTITLFQAVILLPDKESPEGGEDNRFGFEILKSSNYNLKKISKDNIS